MELKIDGMHNCIVVPVYKKIGVDNKIGSFTFETMEGLNAVQLSIVLKTNFITSKCSSGVFARDELENITSNPPQITIVNVIIRILHTG